LWHIVPSVVVYLAIVLRDMEFTPNREHIIPVYYIAVGCALFACVNLPRAWEQLIICRMPPEVYAARQAIDQYLDLYRGHSSLQMGDGSVAGDYRAELHYIPIFKGQPYTVEGNTGRFDTFILPFPANVLTRMKTCKDDVWLIPHAQQPFDVWVLPNSLRTTFAQNYHIDRSDGIYDAWLCNHAGAH
jgi:hypothetical protein